MNFRILTSAVLSLLLALPALAAPTKLAQQGRVLDSAGEPLEGTHDMSFSLFDAATDGSSLWTEERNASFEAGYYSITLGEQVPLDDLLFTAESIWLEVSIDGETLSPRQEVVSVPYALRATAAEHVEGGMVDAEEISVDGTVVIDASGNWVGPTPEVGWGDLSDVPPDIADGDQDTDTLAGLACTEGQLPKWDATASLWVCGDDIDTLDPNTDTLAVLICGDGDVATWEQLTQAWVCTPQSPEVDPIFVASPASSITTPEIASWTAAAGWGDHNAAGYLSAEADPTFASSPAASISAADTANWTAAASWGDHNAAGYLSAEADPIFGASVASLITQPQMTNWDTAHSWGDHSIQGYSTTDTLASLSCVDGAIPVWDHSAQAWECGEDQDTDSQLTETEVDAFVSNNGYLLPDASGNVGIGTNAPNERLTVQGTIETTSGGVRFPDGTLQTTAAMASGGQGTVLYTRCAWTGSAASSIGSCSPPSCPSGWSDLGVTGNIKSSVATGGNHSTTNGWTTSAGHRERTCSF